jgi:hypothetical protein
MHTPDQRAALIASIRALPDQLAETVATWSDEQLDYRPAPGEWCARQVVHHVADSHMNAYIRTKLALSEDTPTVKPYDQEAWAEMIDTTVVPIEESLMLIEALHARWAALWEGMSEAQYGRAYYHPGSGKTIALDDQLAEYSQHGLDHIEQIARIAREQGWA